MTMSDYYKLLNQINVLSISFHDNLVKYYDFFENNKKVHLVIEECEGGTIFVYSQSRGYCLKEQFVGDIVNKIAKGLEFLHFYGFVHKNLNLENILMVENLDNSDLKINGFSNTQFIGPDYMFCDSRVGTLNFMAPEILILKPYNKLVDIYSTGIIAYALLSGILPFDDLDNKEIERQIVNEEVPFPKLIWDKLSLDAKNCIQSKININLI